MQTQSLISKLEKCHYFIWTMKGNCSIEVEAKKILQGEVIISNDNFEIICRKNEDMFN